MAVGVQDLKYARLGMCAPMLTGRVDHTRPRNNVLRFVVGTQAAAPARSSKGSPIARLARFFPDATPVKIAVRLSRLSEQSCTFAESTIIEYGTSREVLFASTLPLEFADLIRIQNSDGTLDAQAFVVAVQYNSGRTAVAARFTEDVPNWIIKP